MDTKLYVRIEGVNQANFIHDVHDLSTIRGGSFLLLDAVRRAETRFSETLGVALDPISTGASSGLFRCAGWMGDRAELRQKIEDELHHDPDLKHATFVVDVQSVDEDENAFVAARESVTAMNRWRQFQQPTLAVPSMPDDASNDECTFDHVRPAATTEHTTDGLRRMSHSVAVRRKNGKERKQHFYADELRQLRGVGEAVDELDDLIAKVERAHFANDLETLTTDESRKSLHWKMAVLHFDGNGFGTRQRACQTPKAQHDFDVAVKTYRRELLRALLTDVFQSRENGWWTASSEIRLETLLWGGDELTWVVPAWKGWDVTRLFYQQSARWTHHGPLTHAGGIVFCHHTSPIHRMTRTAQELAELCKSFIRRTKPGDEHPESDLFAYQVFESSDLISGDLERFRETRVPAGSSADELIVRGAGIENVVGDFAIVKGEFPRSKLHEIVLALRERDASEIAETAITRMEPAPREALARIFRFFGGTPNDEPWKSQPAGWFHLAELWDYVAADGK